MTFTFDKVDLAACRAAGHLPATIVVRERPQDVWLVAAGHVVPGDPRQVWTTVRTSGHVYVPLLTYQTNDRDPAAALAFAFELGVRAVTHNSPHGTPVRVHVAFGDEVEDLGPSGTDAFKFHMGVAIQAK